MRHASTGLNNPSNPQVRAWENVPLSKQGNIEAQMTAMRLRKYKPQYIISSDFIRDCQTANWIAQDSNIPMEQDFDARTWDVGLFSGEMEKDVQPRILEFYKNPSTTPPGSTESFNDFSKRWIGLLDRKMELAANCDSFRPLVIVTHGRNTALTQSYIDGIKPEDCYMPFPSGMGVISVQSDGSLKYDLQEPIEPVMSDV